MDRKSGLSGLAVAVSIVLTLGGCATTEVTSNVSLATKSEPTPVAVYVGHFILPEQAIQSESLMARFMRHARREQAQAYDLADRLEQDIAQDLTKKGIAARRLMSGETLPHEGWLVEGTIAKLNEGSRLRRTIIGFGAGRTDVQVSVTIRVLSSNQTSIPLNQMQVTAHSGRNPGAILSMNPYVAAVKFVLAGHDLEREEKRIAAKIADHIDAQAKGAAQTGPAEKAVTAHPNQ